MSVIVTSSDGTMYLFTKGADNILRDKVTINKKSKVITDKHLLEYSKKGLRTLMIVYKEISKKDLEDWEIEYNVFNKFI